MKSWSSKLYILILALCLCITTGSSRQQLNQTETAPASGEISSLLFTARKLITNVKSVPYIPASIPMRLYECLRGFSMLRCTKAYVLQKLEEKPNFVQSGNLTRDFLNQFFGNEEEMGSLVSGKFANMSDKELNHRLVVNFQRFFKQRDIKLHFLPGLMVKVVPSKENKLKFSIRQIKTQNVNHGRALTKAEDDENISLVDEGEHEGEMKRRPGMMKKKKQHSYKQTMIQMAVPIMILPAILMGSFLPFVLPVLKMATFMTMMMNNSAFLAALLYAARTHANAQDEQPITYAYSGFHK